MYGIHDGTKVIARFTAPLTVKSNKPIFASDALSLKRHIIDRNAQRWEVTAGLEPLSHGANDLFSMVVVKGQSSPFDIIMPQNIGVINARTSTGVATAVGSEGATTVDVSGNTGLIPNGCFIRFGNHRKIYMLTQGLNGNGTMHIYPSLQMDISGHSFFHDDDVKMSCFFDTDVTVGMAFSDGILMDLGTLKFVEEL